MQIDANILNALNSLSDGVKQGGEWFKTTLENKKIKAKKKNEELKEGNESVLDIEPIKNKEKANK